jgi:hypothetical protein
MQNNTQDMENSGNWSTTINRRYDLLRTFILLLAGISPVFTIINYFRGIYSLALLEFVVFLISLWMLYLSRNFKRLRLVSFLFIVSSCSLGFFASASPGAHPTVAVWNALCPFFAFYLLGKRKGAVITFIYIPISTGLYMLSHRTGVNAIPLVAVMNIGIFMLCISWIAYHATTRVKLKRSSNEIEDRRKEKGN